jgi:1-deoxy-D-xylulose-5-phosphate synthase
MLSKVDGPADLRGLSIPELERLCGEVRDYVIETVTHTGGHLAPSLGVVELTVALHRVFDSPRDRIVWDVGHQCYAHKILTGRREAFRNLRQMSGPSGFCRRSESEHDAFGAGHASTSISAALGIATARDARGEDYRVLAVIGDGGLSGGLAFEGLDNAGGCGRDLIVILNDNNMSISPTVGALSRHLTEIITHPLFERVKKEVWEFTRKLPRGREAVRHAVRRIEGSLKGLLTPGIYFESLGFRYLGPTNGHDLGELIGVLERVRLMHGPILVHVLTQKGRGLADAEEDPCRYHGVAPRLGPNGKTEPVAPGLTYTQVFGETMVELAQRHPELTAITAAMCDGTGLARFAERFPERFHDVGIAEGHAITFAAGLATQGLRPVAAIYSTFLQRAFDQLIHDVALQRLPVILALDRAGLVGEDGATHHGAFDLSYLSCMPEMVVAAPASGRELRDLLETAMRHESGPFAIRYPRAVVPDADALEHEPAALVVGEWQVMAPGGDAVLLAVGAMVEIARDARRILAARGLEVGLVNARFVKPLDVTLLKRLALEVPLLVTIEENSLSGGFGCQVARALGEACETRPGSRLLQLGLPDAFVPHAARGELLASVGLTPEGIAARTADALRAVRDPSTPRRIPREIARR